MMLGAELPKATIRISAPNPGWNENEGGLRESDCQPCSHFLYAALGLFESRVSSHG